MQVEWKKFADSFAWGGFKISIQSEQKFNVLCVTKRNDSTNIDIANFHQNITGEVVVRQVLLTREDINVSRTIVTFDENDYYLSYTRNGLSGSALVIGIHNKDEEPYDEWELYTDTPSANPDRPGETVTSKELHERAQRMIRLGFSR